MKITIDIPEETIADLMTSFIESGDPVTNGWCSAVNFTEGDQKSGEVWYAQTLLWESEFLLRVEEVGEKIVHKVTREEMIKGLEIMSTDFPKRFANILSGDTDAADADIFIQCVVFGEEKYA